MTLPDPRIVGSHNPGATNVLRIGGRQAAIGTLIGDIIKTALPILLALELGYSAINAAWLGVFSLLGHCFPIYFSFKGGKGVASMLTIIVIVLPPLAMLAIGGWLVSLWAFQRASVASLITALIVPIYANQFYPELLIPLTALSAVVYVRHSSNIANILQAKEPIIGEKQ
jgi:glycerol-3-phosphate acyltransferase PlsY